MPFHFCDCRGLVGKEKDQWDRQCSHTVESTIFHVKSFHWFVAFYPDEKNATTRANRKEDLS